MDQSDETGQTNARDASVDNTTTSQSATSSTRDPRLPQELLDAIIDNLHNKRVALRSLALVCHAFVPKAQGYLHRRVHLVRDIPKLQRAADLYTSSALLAYVQELVIDLPPCSEDEHAALAAVTPIFASVKRLVLIGCTDAKGSSEFDKGYDFLASFRAFQSLAFINYRPPYTSGLYNMLSNVPCISRMEITRFFLNPPGEEAQNPEHTFAALPRTRDILPCLQRLSLIHISKMERELVTWLSTVIRPGGCSTLRLSTDNFSLTNVLTSLCGANLAHLEIHSWPVALGASRISNLRLDDNTSLRTLHLTSNFGDSLPRLKTFVQAGHLPCLTMGSLRELHFASVLGVPLVMFFAQVEEFLCMLGQLPDSPAANLSVVFFIRAASRPGSRPGSKTKATNSISLADNVARLEAPVRERFCPGTVRSISVRWVMS